MGTLVWMNPSPRKAAMLERRSRWRSIVEQAALSSLPIRQFCVEHQVDEQQYYYWRRILAHEQGAVSVASPASRFVLVRPEAAAAADSASATLELMLDRGWRLRIPRGVDEATLRCVLTALTPQT
jgi:transposase-like protein